jgi:glycosyltransferase involved in cell wall biosynthesis
MGKSENVKASVIIPTFNKAERLKITLLSIAQLSLIEECEVIIVNDGSTDNTADVLNEAINNDFAERINLRVITTENLGRSHARNCGIKNASGKLLIFSDDDLILDHEFALNHIARHKDDDNLVIHGRIYDIPFLKFFKNPSTGELYDGGFAKGQLKNKTIEPNMFLNGGIIPYLKNNARIGKFEKNINALHLKTSINDSYVRWIAFVGGNASVLKKNMIDFDSDMGKDWGCEDLETGYRLYKKGMYFDCCDKSMNYHMNHYRDNFKEIHNRSLSFFCKKHKDISIQLLAGYFKNEIPSLIEWKDEVDKVKLLQKDGL